MLSPASGKGVVQDGEDSAELLVELKARLFLLLRFLLRCLLRGFALALRSRHARLRMPFVFGRCEIYSFPQDQHLLLIQADKGVDILQDRCHLRLGTEKIQHLQQGGIQLPGEPFQSGIAGQEIGDLMIDPGANLLDLILTRVHPLVQTLDQLS